MRIIAGKYKGRKLNSFKLNSTRPTADMVRESLFNKLGAQIINCTFLDLFAGTGAVGIEALSRKAKICYFVDKNSESVNLIQSNIVKLDIQNGIIIHNNFLQALKNFVKDNIKFDYIFLDPPYETDYAEQALVFLQNNNLLTDFGQIVWEHNSLKLQFIKEHFPEITTKKYGIKYLSFFSFSDISKNK